MNKAVLIATLVVASLIVSNVCYGETASKLMAVSGLCADTSSKKQPMGGNGIFVSAG